MPKNIAFFTNNAIKGVYDATADYVPGDIVIYDGAAWIANEDTKANTPAADAEEWQPVGGILGDIVKYLVGVSEQVTDKELILASSTASSTKKFKITVIDAGTISATEIT